MTDIELQDHHQKQGLLSGHSEPLSSETPEIEPSETRSPYTETTGTTNYKTKTPIYKRKWFWYVAPLPLLFLLFLLFLLKRKDHHDDISKSVENPLSYSSFSYNNETINEENSWRLDTDKNYTMNPSYWKKDYGVPQDRHYYFNLTVLTEVNTDGAVRNLTVINGKYPGPLIEANSGDTVYIHVQNQISDQPASIHCHGLYFIGNPYDDGAVGINQCGIPAGGNYTYKVPIDENESGTYWYHSHWATQYADGVFGPIVIHSKQEDELLQDYDEDVVFLVNDFYHDTASTYLADYLAPDNENAEPTPDDGFINGVYSQSANYIVPTNSRFKAMMYFDPEKIYRIRVINAGFFIPFEFSVDNHNITLVEADGALLEPTTKDYIDISVAQRYSLFLNCHGEKDKNYFIHTRFNRFCFATDNPDFDIDVTSILSYTNEYSMPDGQATWGYGGGDVLCRDIDPIDYKNLNDSVAMNTNGSNRPDEIVMLDVAFLIGAYTLDKGYFNDETYVGSDNSSNMYDILSGSIQLNGIENKLKNNYILNFDKRGTIVDLILNNYDDGAHPFHMHGHKFWVIAYKQSGTFHYNDYEKRPERLNFDKPLYRDTINIAPFGYIIIRFVVEHPGVWPFHCHIGWHLEAGLLLTINELTSEYSQIDPPAQWKDFCGAVLPDPACT
ncbi:oxidoreductase activity protein [[Candida] boidinii]|nr:oxidoreductase activity protein [[Candida] boidinii]